MRINIVSCFLLYQIIGKNCIWNFCQSCITIRAGKRTFFTKIKERFVRKQGKARERIRVWHLNIRMNKKK